MEPLDHTHVPQVNLYDTVVRPAILMLWRPSSLVIGAEVVRFPGNPAAQIKGRD